MTDRHTYAAHKMLGMEFSHLFGLQSTLLCQNGGFQEIQDECGYFPEGKCYLDAKYM